MKRFNIPTFGPIIFGAITFGNIIFGEESGGIPLVWILTTGYWSDTDPWLDTETWNDGPLSMSFSSPESSQYVALL